MPQFLLDSKKYDLVTIDFETYYDKDYTLRKMSTSLYIFDDRFYVHGIGISINGEESKYYHDKDVKRALNTIDWSQSALLAHHTHFDGLILFHHYGIKPAYYLDTLSMARPILQNTLKSLSLDSIAKYFGIQGKLSGLEDTKGKYKLTAKEAVRLGIYCKNDVDITVKIFSYLYQLITREEIEIIHLTIQMYAHPVLKVDEWLIDLELEHIIKYKKQILENARKLFPKNLQSESALTVLRSANKFAEVLHYNGCKPPTKISLTTGKQTYAFAANDLDFQKLANHKNIDIQTLYKARLVSKSDTALNKAKILKQFAQHGCCPVYINYWKTQTGRWSGCVTPDHEILTKIGWIHINKWSGQEIEVWDPISKTLQFEIPERMNVFEYNDYLYSHNSDHLKFSVTDQHGLPINNKSLHRVDKREAIDLYNKNAETFISGRHVGTENIDSNKLKLMIAFQADGTFNKKLIIGNSEYINGVKFELSEKIKIIWLKEILHELNIPYTVNKTSRNNTRFFIPIKHVKYLSKNFSWKWLNLKPEYQKIILNEVLHWDGHTEHNRCVYYTTNKHNAEIIATLAHLNNMRAYIRSPKKVKSHYKQRYIVSFTQNQTAGYIKKQNWSKYKYTGKVYCPTTSTGYFLIRKNNTISITGNSDKIQLQNLPRGGAARLALTASEDHVLLVSDLSQVELRVSAWFSDQKDVLNIFASGKDVYKDMATKIYGVRYEDVTKDQRMVAKVTCLGPDTKVLTNNGIKRILDVSFNDRVWDGEQWVQHKGVIFQGLKPVIQLLNIYLTPDHLILCGNVWKTAVSLLQIKNIKLQVSDIRKDLLLLQAILQQSMEKGIINTLLYARVPIQSILLTLITLIVKKLRAAPFVLVNKRLKLGSLKILKPFQTLIRVLDCSIDYVQPYLGAITHKIHDILRMGLEESKYIKNGVITDISFWNTYLPYQIITTHPIKWIELTTTGITNPVISVLQRHPLITKTKELFLNWKKLLWNKKQKYVNLNRLSPVYDLLDCGPNNRFTVLTSSGTVTVHNCLGLGYGCGIPRFDDMLKSGQMGPKVNLPYNTVALIHSKYRQANYNIVKTWNMAGKWLEHMLEDTTLPPISYKGLTFSREQVKFPNGTIRYYPKLRVTEHGDISFQGSNGVRRRIYSSLFYENIVQALARDIIAEQMVKISKHYRIVLSVHDELVMNVPFVELNQAKQACTSIMSTSPSWCKDLPLDCEADWDICYSK